MIKRIVNGSFAKRLKKAVCDNNPRDIVLFGDHFIEPQSIPQDNYYMFMYMMESNQQSLQPYYVMNRDCPLYKEAKEKYGSHIIGYTDSRTFRFEILKYLKRTKIVCDSYQVFNHVIPGFSMAAKSSPYLFTVFTQHGVNFFKETFVKLRSFSSFMFDKVVVANDYEKRIFLERGLFQPQNIVDNGLCRWDFIKSTYNTKTIFLFFTHRRYLAKLRDVRGSVYYKTIVSFVKSLSESRAVTENGYKIKIALHHSVLDKFGYDLLQGIEVVKDEEIEAVKSEADLLVTDYSSMCFEMWYQKKPVVFLRIPDSEDCIIHDNLTDLISPYKKTGPYICNICDTVEECIGKIENYIDTGFEFTEREMEIRKMFFYFDDSFRARFMEYILSLKAAVKDWYVLPVNKTVRLTEFSDIYVTNVDFPNTVGRWTTAREADISFRPADFKGSLKVKIRCNANIAGKQQTLAVKILAGGRAVHEQVLSGTKETDIVFTVPESCIGSDGILKITLRLPKAMRHDKIHPASDDRRYIGLNLITLGVFEESVYSEYDEKGEPFFSCGGIYSGIFDVVEQNMADAGKEFTISKEAFLYNTIKDINTVDILEMNGCEDNRAFAQLAYSMLLKRLPDARAMAGLESSMNKSAPQFHAMVINRILSSAEFKKNSVCVKNNIYAKRPASPARPAANGRKARLREKLVKIYQKQPRFIQKIEKKIMTALRIKL